MNNIYLRALSRNDWVPTICDLLSDDNDTHICSSWLIYYLGSKNEDEFITPAVKLGYLIVTKKIDNITTAIM